MLCLQEAVITKDFALPLSKEAFKSTLEAYSIGVPKEHPCPKVLGHRQQTSESAGL